MKTRDLPRITMHGGQMYRKESASLKVRDLKCVVEVKILVYRNNMFKG